MRNHSHFGGPPADYQTWQYATDAATALRQLDDAYENWIAGVRASTTMASPAVRNRGGSLRRVPVRRAGPAHQPRGDSPRRRNRLHPRSLRAHPEKKEKQYMPGMPPPVPDERQTLLEFLRFNQNAFFAVAYGLTDEQARSTPSVSALSIGGLIKHAAGVQRGWMNRVESAPEYPPRDERPMEEIVADYEDEYVMRDDETLEELLDKLRAQNEETLRSSPRPTSTRRFRCPTMCRGFRRTWTSGRCAGWRYTSSRS